MTLQPQTSVLGLDIGNVRIGVARASWPDGIPTRLTVLANDATLSSKLAQLVTSENSVFLVAGLPRSLEGRETDQTRLTRTLVDSLRQELKLPIYLQDEAGTSLKAEAELRSTNKNYLKSDIDQLSAVYILEDFMNDHKGGKNLG
jgi:putative Holliday junction resolvase